MKTVYEEMCGSIYGAPLADTFCDNIFISELDAEKQLNNLVRRTVVFLEMDSIEISGCTEMYFYKCRFKEVRIQTSNSIIFLECQIDRLITDRTYSDVQIIDSKLREFPLRGLNGISNLSGTTYPYSNPTDWLEVFGQRTCEGYIFYKGFVHNRSLFYAKPNTWLVRRGAILKETVDFNRMLNCSYGVNISSLPYLRGYLPKMDRSRSVWKCLVFFEDLANICIPYFSSGNLRAGRVLLVDELDDIL